MDEMYPTESGPNKTTHYYCWWKAESSLTGRKRPTGYRLLAEPLCVFADSLLVGTSVTRHKYHFESTRRDYHLPVDPTGQTATPRVFGLSYCHCPFLSWYYCAPHRKHGASPPVISPLNNEAVLPPSKTRSISIHETSHLPRSRIE